MRHELSISCCQDSITPIYVNTIFDACKIRRAFMDASDTCDQLSSTRCLKTMFC